MEIKVDTTSGTVTLDGRATYNAQELLALIGQLGQCRQQIGPLGVDPRGASSVLPIDPSTFLNRGQDHFTLAFEHPWFGWTGMRLSDAEVLRLAAVLFQTANVIATDAGLTLGPIMRAPYGTSN